MSAVHGRLSMGIHRDQCVHFRVARRNGIAIRVITILEELSFRLEIFRRVRPKNGRHGSCSSLTS